MTQEINYSKRELDEWRKSVTEHNNVVAEVLNNIKESRVATNELIVKTIQEEIQKKVNGKLDRMAEENLSRGEAILDIGLKLKKFIDDDKIYKQRAEPMIQVFEKNKMVGNWFFAKAKFLAIISGYILAIVALGNLLKDLLKDVLK